MLENIKGTEEMNYTETLARIEELSDEYVKFLMELCDIESPTDYKEGVDAAGRYVADKARIRGWEVEVHHEDVSGDAVCITMNPDAEGKPICFSAHLDTVHPVGLFGYPPSRIEENRLHAPGAVDCKGGVAAAFLAMAALDDLGFKDRPIKLILQSDEENSSITSQKRTVDFMEKCAEGCVGFFNCEGLVRHKAVCIERKGIIRYVFDIKGAACHSSRCFEGKNAILEAAHKIIELERWKEDWGITCNCGVIEGGTVANTVAESCSFTADIRFMTEEELSFVKRRVEEIASTSYIGGTETTLTVKSFRVNMEVCERNVLLLDAVNSALKSCGIEELTALKARGGSDAADMTYRGVPVIDNMGVDGGYIHSDKEYAFIESIGECAKRLAAIALYL